MKINNKYISGNITIDKINVNFSGKKLCKNNINITAANPPDILGNYSGSSLPFPNTTIAFEQTQNKFEITSQNFDIKLLYPNSYYCILNGKEKILPTIYISDENYDNIISVTLEDNCPLKTLISRNHNNLPEFYNDKNHVLPTTTGYKSMMNYANYKLLNNKG
jgi:hypothetical protein|tara:strand:- start:740 stop:1228 length:489 start_codon:yes stop_codon:yes gene_type:complete